MLITRVEQQKYNVEKTESIKKKKEKKNIYKLEILA